MNLRDALRKAAEILVELPPEELNQHSPRGNVTIRARPPVEDVADKLTPTPYASAMIDADKSAVIMPSGAPLQPASPDTSDRVDFANVYRQANIVSPSFAAEQFCEMLDSLPQGLSPEMNRQTVRASFNTMGKAVGATADAVAKDAANKQNALSAYVDDLAKQTAAYVSAQETAISALQAQMEQKRQMISEAQTVLNAKTQECTDQAKRLQQVLDFFADGAAGQDDTVR